MEISAEIKKDFKPVLDKLGASNIKNIKSGIQFNIKRVKSFVDTIILVKKQASYYDIEFWSVGICPYPTLNKHARDLTKEHAHSVLNILTSGK